MGEWYVSAGARSWVAPTVRGDAIDFHRSMPGYAPTPLVELPALAAELAVGRVLVKDESSRLGLPAFKILGASWACHQVQTRTPGAHLVAATDGNHGRAVARMGRLFGLAVTVFVPAVMLDETAARIAQEGAAIVRVVGDYDEAVRCAARFTDADPQRVLVQDTAWEGYTEIPGWIVDGYRTLLQEVDDELTGQGCRPDLVAVPVGVGSLAEAVVSHYRQRAASRPSVLSVEPISAAGLLSSLAAGVRTSVPTAETVMAGLNCGSVSASAWPVLRDGLDAAVAVTDAQALQGVHDLASFGLSAGSCGAATLAGVRVALSDPARRAALQLAPDAVVVLLSTEGNSR